ncbi:hypothetical protein X748_27770 [Mesorhizobium sp. LNJC386A00]|nr:hypothetical protein X748_27770 [Mesorhizobium sp. LNJC386A00]
MQDYHSLRQCDRVQRFWPIFVAESAAMMDRAFDDSAPQTLSAPLLHACRRPFDRANGNGAGLAAPWRRLAAWPGDELLTEKNLAAVLEEFGYAPG